MNSPNTKLCSRCKIEKSLSDFHRNSKSKDGVRPICKTCQSEYGAKRYQNPDIKQRVSILAHERYQKQEVRDRKKETQANWQNRPEVKERRQELQRLRLSIPEKKERVKQQIAAWGAKPENRLRRQMREKERLKTDLQFKIGYGLRRRLTSAIKSNTKAGSAVRDLGCTIAELKLYLESKFQPGMTWDNWTTDGWHIDHIRPLSSFDLTDRNQFLQACHYTNLQPLWAEDNLRKSNKYNPNEVTNESYNS